MPAKGSPVRPAADESSKPELRPLEGRIGTMQGRLVASRTGELECSPGSSWRDEFEIAGELGLNHVELLAERHRDLANPVWSSTGRAEMKVLAARTGIELASLCVNEPLSNRYDEVAFGRELASRLAGPARDLELRVVVVPLLEASDLGIVDHEGAAQCVRLLAEALPSHTHIALELGTSASDCLRFVDSIAVDRVGICYDIGNATALGFDPAVELRQLAPRLLHVHAKDKNAANENVRFGTGLVDFESAFKALSETGFAGLVTMEATRGDDPVLTAADHVGFLLSVASRAEVSVGSDGF